MKAKGADSQRKQTQMTSGRSCASKLRQKCWRREGPHKIQVLTKAEVRSLNGSSRKSTISM